MNAEIPSPSVWQSETNSNTSNSLTIGSNIKVIKFPPFLQLLLQDPYPGKPHKFDIPQAATLYGDVIFY